jgi:cytochrome c-type biogenesis protein CcsB
MLNVRLFDITTVLFGVASVNYVAALYGKKDTLARIGTWVCIAAAVVSTAALGVRWAESYKMGIGRIPVTNLYESLVFFAWSVNLFYLFVEWKYRNRTFGAFVMPIAFGTMLFAFTNESSIQPLVPALQSYWLHAHVITCFVGYAAFAVSAGVAVMYLLKAKREGAKVQGGVVGLFPATKVLDDLVYRSIIWGFPFLTAGIITGAAWANYAWGTYWSWDPKETAGHPGLARKTGGDPVDRRVRGHALLLPGSEPGPVGAALLRRSMRILFVVYPKVSKPLAWG